MKKSITFLLALCCFAQVCLAQAVSPVNAVPITKEPSHHLVFENEYVRVFKVEVAPHAETLYHKHDVDYVFVTLGDSDVESVRVGEKPVRLQLKDGETRFTKGGFAHKAVNNSDKPFVNVTVELKKSLGTEPRNCDVGSRCKGEILNKGKLVQESTAVFTNGSASVISFHLVANSSVENSTFCLDGKCILPFLIVPLTKVIVKADGVEKSLEAGEAFFAKPESDLGFFAGENDARWVLIEFAHKFWRY
jgi:hypothetical protein